jgi:hypothetical protein
MTLAVASGRQYDPALWTFMVLFTQMQLIEYFLWRDLKVPRLNALWSKVGLFVIALEPVAAIYLIKDTELRRKMLMAYGAYIAMLLLTQKFDFRTVVGGNGHLEWKWGIPDWLPALPWFIFFLAPILISKRYDVFAYALGILLVSMYFYMRYNTISSMWCWFAVFGWLYYFWKSQSK